MQVEPSTRFANRALDSGERFLRRRTLYPAEVRDHVLEILILQGFRAFRSSCPRGVIRAFRVSWLTAGGVFDFHRPFIFRLALAGWR